MHLRTLLVLLVLGILGMFAAVNWSSFMAPTTLSLLFATIRRRWDSSSLDLPRC